MKKAIQIGYNPSFEMKCKFASLGGFQYIAVNFTQVLGKSEYEWDQIIDDIRRILEENKLQCIQTHPYYYDLRLSSEICEEQYEFAIKQAIMAGGKLGASWSALHPRSSINSGFRSSKSLEDNYRYFSEYLEVAEKYNTGIAAENLPIFHDIIPVMPFYSCDFDDLMVLVDKLNDKRAGICWDTGHAHLMHFDQAEAIKTLSSRIQCTHIHNNFKNDDNHLPPDNGSIPWEKVMPALASTGYDGALTLETHCCYPDPDLLKSFARHNYECLVFLEKLAK